MVLNQSTQCFGSARVLFCPVKSGAGEQRHAVAIDAGVQAIAVVFDFVGPAFPAWRFVNKLC
jgi:hypothetical protein